MLCAEPVAPEIIRLSPVQLDALRELANIGAGHAATALSGMTGRRVDIGVPNVSLTPRVALRDLAGHGERPLALVRLRCEEPLSATIAVAFAESAARSLSNMLLGREAQAAAWFDALGASAIKEVGNVLAAAYLNALASVTGWTLNLSVPDLVAVHAGWASEMLGGGDAVADHVICLETSLRVDGSADEVRGHVLLMPRAGTVGALMSAIGL